MVFLRLSIVQPKLGTHALVLAISLRSVRRSRLGTRQSARLGREALINPSRAIAFHICSSRLDPALALDDNL